MSEGVEMYLKSFYLTTMARIVEETLKQAEAED